MENAPVTITMVGIAVVSIGTSTGFLLWILKQLRDLKDEIAEMVKASEDASEKRLSAVTSEITGQGAKIAFLNEKLHSLELKCSEDRAKFAETYMTKSSAGVAIDKLAQSVDSMRASFDARFVAIENHLRSRE